MITNWGPASFTNTELELKKKLWQERKKQEAPAQWCSCCRATWRTKLIKFFPIFFHPFYYFVLELKRSWGLSLWMSLVIFILGLSQLTSVIFFIFFIFDRNRCSTHPGALLHELFSVLHCRTLPCVLYFCVCLTWTLFLEIKTWWILWKTILTKSIKVMEIQAGFKITPSWLLILKVSRDYKPLQNVCVISLTIQMLSKQIYIFTRKERSVQQVSPFQHSFWLMGRLVIFCRRSKNKYFF